MLAEPGGMVKRGRYLFVTGVDLDVRAKLARSLDWQRLPELIGETRQGNPSVRQDWPCKWRGLKPLGMNMADWKMRCASAFQLDEDG